MKYLSDKVVYLAGSMHAVADDGVIWREYITHILTKRYNINVLDPSKRSDIDGKIETKDDKKYFKTLIKNKDFQTLKNDFYKIVRKDLKMVDRSDFLIVHYDPSLHMFGSIHEMIVASNAKKPILVKYDSQKIDDINPWLFTLIKPNWAFSSWHDMIIYLDKIHMGEIDTSHWW